MANLEAKVVVLGSQGVGKTSLIHRYVGHLFVEHTSPTIGASFFSCNVSLRLVNPSRVSRSIEENRVKLLIWDTAGQERFRAMAPMYYRNANAALLTFDITSRKSYEDMKSWVRELKGNVESAIVMCVVGNKCDKKGERVVPTSEASTFATSIGSLYHETSALNSEGVESVFIDISQELVQQTFRKAGNSGEEASMRKTFREGKVIRLSSTNEARTERPSGEERSFLCC